MRSEIDLDLRVVESNLGENNRGADVSDGMVYSSCAWSWMASVIGSYSSTSLAKVARSMKDFDLTSCRLGRSELFAIIVEIFSSEGT